jgi:hypothetical protein
LISFSDISEQIKMLILLFCDFSSNLGFDFGISKFLIFSLCLDLMEEWGFMGFTGVYLLGLRRFGSFDFWISDLLGDIIFCTFAGKD